MSQIGSIVNTGFFGLFTPDNPAAPSEGTPTATIHIGVIPQTDDLAQLVEEDQDTSIWADYVIRNRFEKDKHIYMMPISSPDGFSPNQQQASPGGSLVNTQTAQFAAFVQLASPTLLWIADWTAARFKIPPNIPDPNVRDQRWVLMDEHLEPGIITTGPDGVTALYRISGTYVYGCLAPSSNTVNDIAFGRPPWLLDNFNRAVPTSLFQSALIDFDFNQFATGVGLTIPPFGIGGGV